MIDLDALPDEFTVYCTTYDPTAAIFIPARATSFTQFYSMVMAADTRRQKLPGLHVDDLTSGCAQFGIKCEPAPYDGEVNERSTALHITLDTPDKRLLFKLRFL